MSEVTSRSTTFHRDSPQREDPCEATISFAGHLALPPKAIQRSRRVEWMELRMRSQRVPFLVVILWLILSLESSLHFKSNKKPTHGWHVLGTHHVPVPCTQQGTLE